jgi:hypothetical protein
MITARIAAVVLFGVSVSMPPFVMGTRVRSGQIDGIVVFMPDARSTWTPTLAQILTAETAFRAALPGSEAAKTRVGRELKKYKRQYYPLRVGNDRRIRILGLHDSTAPVHDGSWLRSPCGVVGGGDRYFEAVYSFKYGTIERIRINSPY